MGLLRSSDGGLSWSSFTEGVSDDPKERALLGMKTAPANGSQMCLTASSNTSYRSIDGARSFHSARRMAAFAFDPHDPSGLSMFGSSGGSVSESADGGKTWMPRGEIPGFSESTESIDWVPTDIDMDSAGPQRGLPGRTLRSRSEVYRPRRYLAAGALICRVARLASSPLQVTGYHRLGPDQEFMMVAPHLVPRMETSRSFDRCFGG